MLPTLPERPPKARKRLQHSSLLGVTVLSDTNLPPALVFFASDLDNLVPGLGAEFLRRLGYEKTSDEPQEVQTAVLEHCLADT